MSLSPEIKAILSDQERRLNSIYWIIDANKKRVRFRMNEIQRELYEEMWFRNVIPKARKEGVTTFLCLFILDQCIFCNDVRAGIIAHNDEDARSIFRDKIKYPYDNLPAEIKELRHTRTDRVQELFFSNNSSVRVIPSGRSGTYNMLLVSEMGQIALKRPDHAIEIKTGAFESVPMGGYIFVESTAHGRGGEYHALCEQANAIKQSKKTLNQLDFKLHFFAWWRKPENVLDDKSVVINERIQQYFKDLDIKYNIKLSDEQKRWYAKKEADLGSAMKSENPSTYEECFEKSLEGAYYASQFRFLRENKRITSVPYFDGILVDTWWDLGYGDTTNIWFTQDVGRQIHVIDYYENSGEGIGFYKDILDEKGYRYGRMVAPHDVVQGELGTGKKLIDMARDVGINFEVSQPIPTTEQERIEACRKIMSVCWFDEASCEKGLLALESYRKEWDERLGCYKDRPLHDWASHGSDAWATFGHNHGLSFNRSGGRREIKRTNRSRSVV